MSFTNLCHKNQLHILKFFPIYFFNHFIMFYSAEKCIYQFASTTNLKFVTFYYFLPNSSMSAAFYKFRTIFSNICENGFFFFLKLHFVKKSVLEKNWVTLNYFFLNRSAITELTN